MGSFLIRRGITFLIMLILITGLVYFVLRLPGDPFTQLEVMNPHLKDEIARMREWSGFNDPWYVGYFKWMKKIVFEWDWGQSMSDKQPVWRKVSAKMPMTIKIQASVLIVGLLCAVPLGIFSARRQYSTADYIFTFFAYIGVSVPAFWLGLLLLLFFGVVLKILPLGWNLWENHDSLPWIMKLWDQVRNLILPVTMGVIGTIASVSRYMRTSMLEEIRRDFVRTARSKGLSENRVIYKHTLRNALIPIVTIMAFIIPLLISGSVITEKIFKIDGMGKMMFTAVTTSDIPVMMGTLTLFAALTLLSLVLQDIMYALVDPRITYS